MKNNNSKLPKTKTFSAVYPSLLGNIKKEEKYIERMINRDKLLGY